MIRYVAIGAVVGFGLAFFLLSHSNEDLTAPPVDVPAAPVTAIVQVRPNPQELMKLRRLPLEIQPRVVDADAGPH